MLHCTFDFSLTNILINSLHFFRYLHKLGATFHGWARRWFVLDRQRNALIYFSDKSERKPRGGAYFSVSFNRKNNNDLLNTLVYNFVYYNKSLLSKSDKCHKYIYAVTPLVFTYQRPYF